MGGAGSEGTITQVACVFLPAVASKLWAINNGASIRDSRPIAFGQPSPGKRVPVRPMSMLQARSARRAGHHGASRQVNILAARVRDGLPITSGDLCARLTRTRLRLRIPAAARHKCPKNFPWHTHEPCHSKHLRVNCIGLPSKCGFRAIVRICARG